MQRNIMNNKDELKKTEVRCTKTNDLFGYNRSVGNKRIHNPV